MRVLYSQSRITPTRRSDPHPNGGEATDYYLLVVKPFLLTPWWEGEAGRGTEREPRLINMLRTALGRHISAARSIGPRAIGVRALSAGSFDGEMSYLYSKMFEQHLHPNGPWKKMVEATQSALGPSGRGVVLDLATGPGEPANMIARALPEATVIATDVSTDMVDKAKERMVGLKNVNFSTLDMQNMSSIESGSVDVVTVSRRRRHHAYLHLYARQRALT